MGVDHFYLYNVGSSDNYENILKPYVKKNIVTLVNWPEAISLQDNNASQWALSTQIPAYENAANFLARNETQWLVFLDLNEFFVSPAGNIKKLLDQYSEFPGITFQAEYIEKTIPNKLSKKILRDESIEVIDFPLEVKDKDVSKIIFKPDQCLGFDWPPYRCRFKEFVSSIEVDQQELRIKRIINQSVVQKFQKETRESNEEITYSIPSEPKTNRSKLIYQQIPEFLKILKSNAEAEPSMKFEDFQ